MLSGSLSSCGTRAVIGVLLANNLYTVKAPGDMEVPFQLDQYFRDADRNLKPQALHFAKTKGTGVPRKHPVPTVKTIFASVRQQMHCNDIRAKNNVNKETGANMGDGTQMEVELTKVLEPTRAKMTTAIFRKVPPCQICGRKPYKT